MLPQFFLDRIDREGLLTKLKRDCGKYIIPENSTNHLLSVMVPYLVGELMDIVVELTNEELSRDDWWVKGFTGNTRDHSGLSEYATLLAIEFIKTPLDPQRET